MASREDFETAFKLLIGHEGGFTDNRADPGNWTGGRVGEGRLIGTKFGISGHSYPNEDIRNMTLARAHDIYYQDFWIKVGCNNMPPRVAFIVFDAAVNNGPARAVRWLQQTVGARVDGAYGPNTQGAINRFTARDQNGIAFVTEFHSHRLRFMVELSTWSTFRGGWSRRLARLPMEAAHYWPTEIAT